MNVDSVLQEINQRFGEISSELALTDADFPLQIETLVGGLSNACMLINGKWVYRKYGSDEEPRLHQQKVSLTLAKNGLSPKPLYYWPGASLEEYVASQSFNHQDFCKQIPMIFKVIDQLHKIYIGEVYNQEEYLGDSVPNVVIEQINRWMAANNEGEGGNGALQQRLPVRARSFYTRLKGLIDNPRRTALLRFRQCICHNDLHPGNILGPVIHTNNNPVLIDLELTGMNYELYDWANLANELEMTIGRDGSYQLVPNPLVEPFFIMYLNVSLADLKFFRNWSHFFWGLWGLAKASNSDSETSFDYAKYSSFRFSLID